MLALLGLIPSILPIITSVVGAYSNAQLQLTMARYNATAEVATAMLQSRVGIWQAIASSPILSLMIVGFAFPIIFFMVKVIIWDTCLGLGSTPAIHGQAADIMNTVVIGIFGATSVHSIATAFGGK